MSLSESGYFNSEMYIVQLTKTPVLAHLLYASI
jgi:hypothetical protein